MHYLDFLIKYSPFYHDTWIDMKVNKILDTNMSLLANSSIEIKTQVIRKCINNSLNQQLIFIFQNNLQPEVIDSSLVHLACSSGNFVSIYLFLPYIKNEHCHSFVHNTRCSESEMLIILQYLNFEPNFLVSWSLQNNYCHIFNYLNTKMRIDIISLLYTANNKILSTILKLQLLKDVPQKKIDEYFMTLCDKKEEDKLKLILQYYPLRYKYELEYNHVVRMKRYKRRLRRHTKRVLKEIKGTICLDKKIPKEECPICYSTSDCVTDCNHQFCKKCITIWNKTCPICRGTIETIYSIL